MKVYGLHKKTDPSMCTVSSHKLKKKGARVIRSNVAHVKMQFKIEFTTF